MMLKSSVLWLVVLSGVRLAISVEVEASLDSDEQRVAATSIENHPNLAAIPSEALLGSASIPGEAVIVGESAEAEPREQGRSARHEAEKANLLKRVSKSHGKWDTNHPRARLLETLFSFSRYHETNLKELNRWKGLYQHVPQRQKTILEKVVGYSQTLESVESMIGLNAGLASEIVDFALQYYEVDRRELDEHIKASEAAGRTPDRISVSQSLKHYVRDWSTDGRSEREAAFPCITATLAGLYPGREDAELKVLLPGAGLGRLGHEVASLGGFEVTNNEWSMYMNVATRFLDAHPAPFSKAIHPFIDSWSHHATRANMFRGVGFPDARVNTSSVLLVEGDFTTVFRDKKGHFDVVVTHFFIDTARNLMYYLETILAVLKPGGHWINFGPLLYGSGPWVQLSLDEVIAVAREMGFDIIANPAKDADDVCGLVTFEGGHIRGKEAAYGFDDKAMTKNAYAAQSWVAVKRK